MLFYDQALGAGGSHRRPEDPQDWRGLARVIGPEGQHGVWLAFRGLIVLDPPERLAASSNQEV